MKKNKPALVIHLKKESQRLKKKNIKKINSVPLFEITFRKFLNDKFFDVYIDSSSVFFKKKAVKYGFSFLKRPKFLNKKNAQGNELLKNVLKKINNDLVIQLFVTNPFIKIETLKKLIYKLKRNSNINSVTAVTPLYNRFWYNKKEVNHKYNKLIGTQYMKPIYLESGVYCFRRKSFLNENSRIAKKNIFYELSSIESFDIDTELDFIIAEKILQNLNIKE